MTNQIRTIFGLKATKQTLLLFSAQLVNALLGIAVSGLNARALSVEEYGLFSFAIVVILFVAWFFDFGLFAAGSRVVALAKSKEEEKRLLGTMIFSCLLIGVGFALTVLVLSLFIDSIFSTNIGALLFALSPLVIVFPFQTMFAAILRGSNEIGKLAAYTVLPRLFYLVAIVIALKVSSLTLRSTLFLYVATLIGATVFIGMVAKPIFRGWGQLLGRILQETKSYGVHIYSGTIVDNLTFGSDKLLISYFLGAVSVGVYTVAQTLTMPISMMSRSLATSVFREFTSRDRIPMKFSLLNFLWLLGAATALILLAKFLVVTIFTAKYFNALSVIPLLTLSSVFMGLNQLYHSFLMAHGKGRYVRNMSIASSSVNVIGNFVLIYQYGLMGAAVAAVLTYGVNYAMNIYYYQKTVNSLIVVQA